MVAFGNPNRRLLPYFKTETYLDTLLPELNSYQYPDNNSQEVVDELKQLVELTNSISENEELQNRFKIYDTDFENYIINVLSNNGIPREDVENTVKEIHDDIVPLLVKLKYSYQRIRPMQLSYLLQIRLYPYDSLTANTPSYPSGHALQSKLYCEVLGNMYPQYYKQLKELAADISNSRLYLGLHYASDCNFSEYISELIIQHPDFKKKYKL